MSHLGRYLPIRIRSLYVREQYTLDLQEKILNVRCRAYSSHPSKLLRNLPLNGRIAPELPFIRRLVKVFFAATSDVPVRQSGLPSTARKRHSVRGTSSESGH